ncbi:MAG: hypothetical protein FWD13_01505 [Treponema sp.]|nr:hypothetical protein [Treponema sp.]
MKNRKTGLIIPILITVALLFTFTGCPPGGNDINVTGVSLSASIGGVSNTNIFAGENSYPNQVTITAAINPPNATNKEVIWTVTPDTYVDYTIMPDGLTVVITSKAVGGANNPTTIKVETVDGGFTSTRTVHVYDTEDDPDNPDEPDDPDKPAPALLLYNQATSPNTGTTIDLDTAWNNDTKRYTIKNTYSSSASAGFYNNNDSATPPNVSVQNATFVYLNNPLTGASSISARVRIIARHGDGSASGGVVIGMMNKPDSSVTQFAGIRVATNGDLRRYISRTGGDNSSNAYSPAITEKPFDEEYILEVTRSAANNYTHLTVKDRFGNTLGTQTAAASNNVVSLDPAYLGFIIARADVEISQIEIKHGTETIITTGNSSPTPFSPVSVTITNPIVEGSAPEYTYTHSIISTNTLVIEAAVLPEEASQNITWTINGTGSSLNTNTGGSIIATFNQTGEVIITATAAGTDKTATLTINVINEIIPVTGININTEGNRTSIMAGDNEDIQPQTLQFTANILPVNATNKTATWSVSETDSYSTSITAAGGSINAETGLFTAVNFLTEDKNVWIFATATDGTDVKSTGYKLTIKPYEIREIRHWDFQTNPTGWTAGNNTGSQTQSSDYNYGQGMTLLSGTGGTSISASPASSARTMGVYPTTDKPPQPNSADRTAGKTENPADATNGYLNVQGAGNFARITGMQGPFTVRVIFTTASNNNDRWPAIQIGTGSIINLNGQHNTPGVNLNAVDGTGPTSTTTFTNNSLWVLQYSYENFDTPDILLKASAAIRIYDVFVIPD